MNYLFSTVILLLLLIQEGLVSVTIERMSMKYWFLVKLVQEKGVVRLTDRLNMTIAVDWAVTRHTLNQKHVHYIPGICD